MIKLITILFTLIYITGCGTDNYGYNSLIDVSYGSYKLCDNGLIVSAGLDYNRNLRLDSNEIQSIKYLCNEVAPSSNYEIVDIIDLCGDKLGYPDEIILQLSDNQFLAWYKNVGLVSLESGTVYTTSDKQKCKFKIVNNEVIEL